MNSLPSPPPPPINPFHLSSAPEKDRNDGKLHHSNTYECLFGVHVLTVSVAAAAFQIVYSALAMLFIFDYGDDGWMTQAKFLYSTILAARIVACLLVVIGVRTGERKLFWPSIAFSWMTLAGTLPLALVDVALSVVSSLIEVLCLYAICRGYFYLLEAEERECQSETESSFDVKSQVKMG